MFYARQSVMQPHVIRIKAESIDTRVNNRLMFYPLLLSILTFEMPVRVLHKYHTGLNMNVNQYSQFQQQTTPIKNGQVYFMLHRH